MVCGNIFLSEEKLSFAWVTDVIAALAIGSILVGEEISLQDYLAVALIFIGVLLVNKNITILSSGWAKGAR